MASPSGHHTYDLVHTHIEAGIGGIWRSSFSTPVVYNALSTEVVFVKETNIRLFRNVEEEDWSVKIDGKLYDHISTNTLDDLLEYTSIAAQQRLLGFEAAMTC
jgi:hypothetical protein